MVLQLALFSNHLTFYSFESLFSQLTNYEGKYEYELNCILKSSGNSFINSKILAERYASESDNGISEIIEYLYGN